VTAAVVGEADAKTMEADGPGQGVGGRGRLEGVEEGDVDFEVGQLGGGDGVETGIIEGADVGLQGLASWWTYAGDRGGMTYDVSA